jgi:acyl carrier protein
MGGLFMTVLTLTGQSRELKETALANNICAYIAEHVGVDAEDVGLATHFNDDLGLDWLDIVELMILSEEQFADGMIADEDNEIETVGDLILHIEAVNEGRRKRPTSIALRQKWGRRSART